MTEAPPETPTRATLDRAAAIARDNLVFSERRARDAENQAKTARLRAMRLAHEASVSEASQAAAQPAKRASR